MKKSRTRDKAFPRRQEEAPLMNGRLITEESLTMRRQCGGEKKPRTVAKERAGGFNFAERITHIGDRRKGEVKPPCERVL